MTKKDKPEFTRVLHEMAETFNSPMSDTRVDGFFAALKDLELKPLIEAMDKAKTARMNRCPVPAILRQMVTGVLPGAKRMN